MDFIKLTTVYYKDNAYHKGGAIILNPKYVIHIQSWEYGNGVCNSIVSTTIDNLGHSLKVAETVDEIYKMLKGKT